MRMSKEQMDKHIRAFSEVNKDFASYPREKQESIVRIAFNIAVGIGVDYLIAELKKRDDK